MRAARSHCSCGGWSHADADEGQRQGGRRSTPDNRNVIEDSMVRHRSANRSLWRLPAKAAIALGAALGAGSAAAAPEWYFQAPVTEIAGRIINLHDFIFWICVVIFVVVFGTMFYSLLKHRKSVGHQAAQFHENTTVEVIWTIIPFFILLFMAYPATKTILAAHDTSSPDMTVKVTGYQWKWNYDYLDDGISYYSNLATPLAQIENREPKGEHYLLEVDNPMVVPVGAKVRVLVTAADVVHAWWVPAFGVKQDAIPGFVRDSWFRADKPGIYRGQCAELCGKEHGFMPIVVEVKSKEDFATWRDAQKQKSQAAADDPNKVWDVAALVDRGHAVFDANCAACHGATATGNPALGAPPLVGDKVVLGPKDHQIDVVLNGQNNGKMPPWKHLSDVEIASVISYTRNSFGNKAEQNVVQPSDVKAARK
jgi:cytochrome c oxidase subunit 2